MRQERLKQRQAKKFSVKASDNIKNTRQNSNLSSGELQNFVQYFLLFFYLTWQVVGAENDDKPTTKTQPNIRSVQKGAKQARKSHQKGVNKQGLTYFYPQTKIDVKSFKRQASKVSQLEQPKPRKLLRVQQRANDSCIEEKSIQIVSEAKLKESPYTNVERKKLMKVINPFNKKFPVEGGQDGLFDYMMGYVSNKKLSQFEQQEQDLGFLDEIKGEELEIISEKGLATTIEVCKKQFQVEKNKIKAPFDQNHKNLMFKLKDIGLKSD